MIVPEITRAVPDKGVHNGFMLLEALIALAVLTSIAGLVASYHAAISMTQYDTRMRLEAITNVSDAVEQLMFGQQPQSTYAHEMRVAWEYQPMPTVHLPPIFMEQPSTISFAMMKVTASWRSSSGMPATVRMYSAVEHGKGAA